MKKRDLSCTIGLQHASLFRLLDAIHDTQTSILELRKHELWAHEVWTHELLGSKACRGTNRNIIHQIAFFLEGL